MSFRQCERPFFTPIQKTPLANATTTTTITNNNNNNNNNNKRGAQSASEQTFTST
jgi:hypothetical protein